MLHPQTQALLQLINQRSGPPLHELKIDDVRAGVRQLRRMVQPEGPPVASVEELQAETETGALPLRLYRPAAVGASLPPALVYFHGGGFITGDLDIYDSLCRQLTIASGCVVVAVGYRLAPEHPFPIPVTDCIAATRWVVNNAPGLGLDPSRIAVGGDSAGATLAAVVAIHARDSGDLPLAFQLLIYPAVDMHRRTRSHQENGQGYWLTRESQDFCDRHYFRDSSQHDDWRASPLLHPDLSHLPPALILTAGFDPLRDEGAEYARRLSESGNKASHVCFSGQIHGFITMGKVLDEAHTAVALCGAEVRRWLRIEAR